MDGHWLSCLVPKKLKENLHKTQLLIVPILGGGDITAHRGVTNTFLSSGPPGLRSLMTSSAMSS